MYKTQCVIVTILLLLLPIGAWAEVKIGGEIEINKQVSLENGGAYLNHKNMNIFTLKARASLSPNAFAYGEFRLKNIGFPDVSGLDDLSDKSKIEPWTLELREAYIELFSFLFDDLDLKIGKQRISWGTADIMNPTDNLNPEDLEDPLNFREKLGVNSLKLTYYPGDFTITAVVIPVFVPAVFPAGFFEIQDPSQFQLPQGLSIGNMTDEINLPSERIRNSIGAVKIARNILGFDMSVSYYKGRYDIPILNRIDLSPVNATKVDVGVSLKYPKMQVVGFDLAGAIGDVGIWAEFGLFIPEKIELETYFSGELYQKETVLDKPYLKYVIGIDYTFKGGFYVNIQYIRGFFTERGKYNLGDYLFGKIENKFLNDKLKISVGGAIDLTDIDNLGFMPSMELSYMPTDNTEIIIGAIILEGKEGTTFGQFRNLDMAYMRFKYSF